MNLTTHFIASLILCIVLYPFFGPWALLVFAGGFLTDVDHYIYYVITEKDLNLKRAYYFFYEKKTHMDVLCVLHMFEIPAMVIALSFFSEKMMIVAFGLVLHMAMDLIHIHRARNLRKELPYMSLITRQFVKK